MKSDYLLASNLLQSMTGGRRSRIGCALQAAIISRLSERRAAFHVYTILIAAARACAVPSGFFQIGLKR